MKEETITAIRVFLSQSTKELAELLLINTLLEAHVEIDTLRD